MKLYYRGPYTSFNYPLNSEATEMIRFERKGPNVTPEKVAQEVSDDVAMDLMTRKGHNFKPLDPADGERLFPPKKKKAEEGDSTPVPLSPSIETVNASENPSPAPSSGDALLAGMRTDLPVNTPATVAPNKIR